MLTPLNFFIGVLVLAVVVGIVLHLNAPQRPQRGPFTPRPPVPRNTDDMPKTQPPMTDAEMAAAFNAWEEEYQRDPDAFAKREDVVKEWKADLAAGRTPSHGELCVRELRRQHAKLTGQKAVRSTRNRNP